MVGNKIQAGGGGKTFPGKRRSFTAEHTEGRKEKKEPQITQRNADCKRGRRID
jgi:hypothetical protein